MSEKWALGQKNFQMFFSNMTIYEAIHILIGEIRGIGLYANMYRLASYLVVRKQESEEEKRKPIAYLNRTNTIREHLHREPLDKP
jgi:hypothetical protein